MGMLDSVPAVRRIDTDRETLCAFDIVGTVNSADLENLFGLLEAAYALHPATDVLLRLTECEGFEGDGFERSTVSEGTEAAGEHVRRCAIVGDGHGIADSRRLFVAVGAGETRHFSAGDEDGAWAWLGARRL